MTHYSAQLQDIFTIHPHTASNTHDLLECPCGGSNESNSPTDLHPKDEDEDVSDGSGGSDEDHRAGFVVASGVQPQHTEKMDKKVNTSRNPPKLAVGAHLPWLVSETEESAARGVGEMDAYQLSQNWRKGTCSGHDPTATLVLSGGRESATFCWSIEIPLRVSSGCGRFGYYTGRDRTTVVG